MVKPGMPYLDVLFNLTQKFFYLSLLIKLVEYAMIKNAINNGDLN